MLPLKCDGLMTQRHIRRSVNAAMRSIHALFGAFLPVEAHQYCVELRRSGSINLPLDAVLPR
jgi:hypothetical protein